MKKKFSLFLIGSLILLTSCKSGVVKEVPPKDDSKVASEVSSELAASKENYEETTTSDTKEDSKEIASSSEETGEMLPNFTTIDLDGNEVTEEIFKDKSITMVNIWATFCGPCISEIPELAKIHDSLPDNATILGIVVDASKGDKAIIQNALKILSDSNAKFENIIADDFNLINYLYNFQAVPTTIFVDSKGKVIGEPIVGARVEKYIERLKEFLPDWKYEQK